MKGKSIFSKPEADQIILLIHDKLKASTSEQKSIRNKIRRLGFYASDFGLRDGYTSTDFLCSVKIIGSSTAQPIKSTSETTLSNIGLTSSSTRDEHYIIDLCDEVLHRKAIRQHKFNFLKGDGGHKLPVDAFYYDLNLVIEYRERQHTEAVSFFNKKNTISGMSREEQRKKYDERRRVLLPQNNLSLIEFDYYEFGHNSQKKLLRNKEQDLVILRKKLRRFI